MNKAKIFLVEGKGKLTPMTETSYDKEDDLQALLADYPDLIPGDQIDFENPRRWLLVAREQRVPGSEEEIGRWSLDHLFLDQDGKPTFIECKRSSDTRGRREVVAQMLDYAANGIRYWEIDDIKQSAEKTAIALGRNLNDEITSLIATTNLEEIESFWDKVEHNLSSGFVRLVFIADTIPPELRRLVEFLNEKMKDVEVLAVEVKQFIGEGQKAIVPRLIGLTESAREQKRTATTRSELLAKCNPESFKFFSDLLDIAEERGHSIYWGTKGFSVRVHIQEKDTYASVAYGFPPNSFQLYFAHLPFSEVDISSLRKDLLALGIFREAPQTITALINRSNSAQAKKGYELMIERVETLSNS